MHRFAARVHASCVCPFTSIITPSSRHKAGGKTTSGAGKGTG